jgi:N-acetylneuraminic acid mutarotase
MRKIYARIIIALLAFSLTAHAQTWVQKDSLPAGNASTSPFSFSINQKLYVGGGYGNGVPLNTFFEYDPSTNIWTPKANVPIAIEAPQSFVINGKGYIACGALPGITNSVYMYDPTTDTWTQKGDFPGTPKAYGMGFSINGKGYISSGFIGSVAPVNDMWEYDTLTDSWSLKANVPGPARNNPMFVIINNQVYLGLGGDVSNTLVYSDFYWFNPDSNTYTPVSNIPHGRSAGAAYASGNFGYIGLGADTNTFALNDFYKFDPTNNSWTQVSNFGGPARAHGFCEVVAGIPYIGCGTNISGGFLSDNWTYGYPASITEVKTDISLQCYPSPATDYFTIKMTGFEIGNKSVKLYDQLGQLVFQGGIDQNEILINDKLSTGLYTVIVAQSGHQESARILVR